MPQAILNASAGAKYNTEHLKEKNDHKAQHVFVGYRAHAVSLNAKSGVMPAAVHNNFGEFLINSQDMLRGAAAGFIQEGAKLKPYQGYVSDGNKVDNFKNSVAEKPIEKTDIKAMLEINNEIKAKAPLNVGDNFSKSGGNQFLAVAQKDFNNSKGYGAKLLNDPLIAMISTSAQREVGFGYFKALDNQHFEAGDDFGDGENATPLEGVNVVKNKDANKAQFAAASSAVTKFEEVEALKKVNFELQKQLQRSHPSVSFPIQHPDGVVDINLRFSSNGNVRALFAGSNPEVVQLMAQNKDEFIKTIKDEGYHIDERQLGFIYQQSVFENITRI